MYLLCVQSFVANAQSESSGAHRVATLLSSRAGFDGCAKPQVPFGLGQVQRFEFVQFAWLSTPARGWRRQSAAGQLSARQSRRLKVSYYVANIVFLLTDSNPLSLILAVIAPAIACCRKAPARTTSRMSLCPSMPHTSHTAKLLPWVSQPSYPIPYPTRRISAVRLRATQAHRSSLAKRCPPSILRN